MQIFVFIHYFFYEDQIPGAVCCHTLSDHNWATPCFTIARKFFTSISVFACLQTQLRPFDQKTLNFDSFENITLFQNALSLLINSLENFDFFFLLIWLMCTASFWEPWHDNNFHVALFYIILDLHLSWSSL